MEVEFSPCDFKVERRFEDQEKKKKIPLIRTGRYVWDVNSINENKDARN